MAALIDTVTLTPGELTDSGIIYSRGTKLVIVNDDLVFTDVLPWGYLDYMSEDFPINSERILFEYLRLNLKATVWENNSDWIPEGAIFLYVLESYPLTQATVSLYDLFA